MGWLPQIPRRLLPDTMNVRVPLPDGSFTEPIAVDHVRFVRTQSACNDEHRAADAGAGKVYVDAVNSSPQLEVPAGSRLDIDGHSYYVEKSRRCETVVGSLHHLELSVR